MQDRLSSWNHSDATPRSTTTFHVDLPEGDFIEAVRQHRNQNLPALNATTKTERIQSLLVLTRYRRGKQSHLPTQDMKQTIQRAVTNDEPIPFLILGFAGKVQNQRCTHDNPDIGEYWALASLNALAEALHSLHKPGANIHVYSDATTYPPIFYEDLEPMLSYHSELRAFTAHLDHVTLHDINDYLPDDLWTRCSQRTRRLQHNDYTSTDEYHNLKTNAAHLVHADDLTEQDNDIRRRRARQAAIRYKAVKTIIRDADLPPENAIRMTTHPKPGQYGFQLINRNSYNYPWNGTAYIKHKGSIRVYNEPKAQQKAQYKLRGANGVLGYTNSKEAAEELGLQLPIS